ncbi:MAG: sugar kinase [Asgard group archaeon]|nr:sugar kinase [Asgard group archaeon]
MALIDKIVVVTKKTWLEELIERFNTKDQAKFYIEQMGGNFSEYEDAHKQYYQSLDLLKKCLPSEIKSQIIEKEFLPNFLFGSKDLVLVIGQDGLVINTAKYLENQYIIGINPDPKRMDGVLLPFKVENVQNAIKSVVNGDFNHVDVTMAVAELNDGQKLYAVNDLFIGHKSHGSARYTITYRDITEPQSSSGIIVSTGAGSTGWFRSILTGAVGIVNNFRKYIVNIDQVTEDDYRFPWNASILKFSVREPFVSKISRANIIFGEIYVDESITIESNMPENGVIFSDGIEKDFLKFNSGTIAEIKIADKKAHLVIK